MGASKIASGIKIQSLSIVVPTRGCINSCKFCVSRMRGSTVDLEYYPHHISPQTSHPSPRNTGVIMTPDVAIAEYRDRMLFASENGCNAIVITGTGEPQQNMKFLKAFGKINNSLPKPFRRIDIQTTGAGITEAKLQEIITITGATCISLSISSFDPEENAEFNGTSSKNFVDLDTFCHWVNQLGVILRLSVNLTKAFNQYEMYPESFFKECRYRFNAQQVTLRELYAEDGTTPQALWIEENEASETLKFSLSKYLSSCDTLGKLEYGHTKYSVMGMSVLFDTDCMAKGLDGGHREDGGGVVKYAILRPNCRLYSQWDDPASIIY